MEHNIIFLILKNTPLMVWVLLFFLVKRGLAVSKEKKVDVKKSFIVPTVFIAWGLEKIINGFTYVEADLLTYALLLPVGILIGYLLYNKNQNFFLKDGELFKRKCYLPLIIILVNFLIKYVLNVFLAINQSLIMSFEFNIFYSMISGISVGLFFGGIINTLINRNQFLKLRTN